jgi:sugar phosphate isomerase/epimerase
MTFSRSELVCYATLPDGYGFEATVAAAAQAGFTEFSFWLMSLDAARKELGSLEAVRACLDRYQMKTACLELLLCWPRGEEQPVRDELAVMQAAVEVFQPELVMAACMEPELADGELAVEFLRLQCQALAPVRVALEFLPWSGVPDIAAARQLVEAINEPNLGYVLDTWHFVRSGSSFAALAELPGEKIFFVQLSDVLAQPDPNIFVETLGARQAPGEGIFDWPRFNLIMRDLGVDCPTGSEMYSDRVKAMGLQQACNFLYQTQNAAMKL